MISKHGKWTGEFGLWLTNYLNTISCYRKHSVFYDHGNKQEHPNVVAIKGFIGNHVTNANRLADVDVLVANDKQEIIVLIEIEESNITPKTLLGDVFASLMCNGFAVRIGCDQKYFTINPDSKLIVSGVVPARDCKKEKFNELIWPRLQQFIVANDSIQVRNIDFVFGKDISSTIDALMEKMKELFPEKDG